MKNKQTSVFKFYNLRAPKQCSQTNFQKFFIKHPLDKLPNIETKDKKTKEEFIKLFGFNIPNNWAQLIYPNGNANQDFIDDLVNDWQSIFKTTNIDEFKNIHSELSEIIKLVPDFYNGNTDNTKYITSIISLVSIYETKLAKYLKSTNLTGQGINLIYYTIWINLLINLYKTRHFIKEDLKYRDNLFLAIKILSFAIQNRMDKILSDKTTTTKPNLKFEIQPLVEVLKNELDKTLVLPSFLKGRLNDGENEQASRTNPYNSKKLDGVIQIGNTQVSLDEFCIKDYDFNPCGDQNNQYSAFPEGSIPKVLGVGVAELIITKSQTAGYSIGDIANVTNILKGEERTYSHRKLDILEQKTEDETETNEENERELQTTEKFDLSKEIDRVVEQESSMEAGLNMTYDGAVVNINSSFNYGSSNSSSETSNESTQYAKDIVSKAISKLNKKVRALRNTMTRKEIEEIATHKFSNIGEDKDNVAGIYCWLNKQINLRNFDFGRRLFLKVYIPSPARQYIHQKILFTANSIEKPIHPKEYIKDELNGLKKWQDITKENSIYWCKAYGIDNIPYPKESETITAQLTVAGQTDLTSIMYLSSNGEISIPDGYKANKVTIMPEYDTANGVSVIVGPYKFHTIGSCPTLTFNELTKSVELKGKQPISLNVRNVCMNYNKSFDLTDKKMHEYPKYQPTSTVINIHLDCELLEETKNKWQQDIYSKIIDSYNRQLTDYKEKKAQMQFQKVEYGTNPNENRIIEQKEIQKHIFSLLGSQYFMSINPITDGAGMYGYPEPNWAEAEREGKYIDYMENLFQFKFMTTKYLDYYWNRKDKWHIFSNIKDNDPQHEAFLQAGGVIVSLPVTPGREANVMYLLETGRLFFGGGAPVLENTTPEISEIIESHRDLTNPEILSNGKAIGTPWTETIPTNEVMLNSSMKLGEVQAELYLNPDEYLNSQYKLDEPFKIQ